MHHDCGPPCQVKVIEHNTRVEGWSLGYLSSARSKPGLFPNNFVQCAPTSAPRHYHDGSARTPNIDADGRQQKMQAIKAELANIEKQQVDFWGHPWQRFPMNEVLLFYDFKLHHYI